MENERIFFDESDTLVFSNEKFGTIHVIMINNEPYFLMKELIEIMNLTELKLVGDLSVNSFKNYLSYHINNNSTDSIEVIMGKYLIEKDIIDNEDLLLIDNGKSCIVNENALNILIYININNYIELREFKEWIKSDVLPKVKKEKDAKYDINEILKDPDVLINALNQLKHEREVNKELAETIAIQKQQIDEMESKVSYYDVVLKCKDLVTISSIAQDYGWSAKRMNKYLHEKGVQYKQNKVWLLYQKYSTKGYTKTKTHIYKWEDGSDHSVIHTYWTQSGRLFIYDLLKKDNILPIIEQE